MLKTFHHIFADGDKITVTVDLSNPEIKVGCVGSVSDANAAEYAVWKKEVIVPEIVNNCTVDQAIFLTKFGIKMLTGSQGGAK